jgi:hypothetical protein
MLEDGVTEKSSSKYINPLWIVLKKDAVRLTIDVRTLYKKDACLIIIGLNAKINYWNV